MIRKYIIAAVVKKYAATKASEVQEIKDVIKEMKALCVNRIKEVYPKELFDYKIHFPKYVKEQDDIILGYDLDIGWSDRRMFERVCGSLVIKLSSYGLPTYLPSFRTIINKETDFYKKETDFCDQFIALKTKLEKKMKQLITKLKAIEDALGAESMNKSSIKKYYPNLYKIMEEYER